jgi:hypothetical protein
LTCAESGCWLLTRPCWAAGAAWAALQAGGVGGGRCWLGGREPGADRCAVVARSGHLQEGGQAGWAGAAAVPPAGSGRCLVPEAATWCVHRQRARPSRSCVCETCAGTSRTCWSAGAIATARLTHSAGAHVDARDGRGHGGARAAHRWRQQ